MVTDRARVGDLEVRSFSDGLLETMIDRVIGIDVAAADAMVGGTREGAVDIPVNNFVFRVDGQTVMIDAGAGATMQPTLGMLPANLRAAEIDPSAVTCIVITHLHPDHANGLVGDNGEALYPNADILVHAKDFDFWMVDSESFDLPHVRRQRARNKINLAPYRERIRRMTDGEQWLGCSPILAPGHCPGHTCWRVQAGRAAFLALGDLVHFSAVQLSHPQVSVNYDLDPDQGRLSRLRILDMAASDGLMIAGAHVNAPGMGYLRRRGAGYAFDPAA